MSNAQTVRVVGDFPEKNKDLITFAKFVAGCLTNNPSFPSPNPTVAVLLTDVTAFDNAETTTVGGSTLATTQRNALKNKVLQDLRHELAYVQSVAETVTDNVQTVVESAGFRLRKPSTRSKPALAVKDGATSGSVLVVAKAMGRTAVYYWEYSLDQKTWTAAPDTFKASVTIGGLTVGQTYAFRVRTMTRASTGGWSQPITHVVR
jgi:hypothetical protein